MTILEKEIPAGFDDPTTLPNTSEQCKLWQESNRRWWETHPMRYDWQGALGIEDYSPEFYQEIDRRFFADAAQYLPPRRIPFDRLMPFEQLPQLDVLEIGVGNGSHAALLAGHARSFTGIDLTDYAVTSTSRRLDLAGLKGRILRMDAERLDFPDHSFDFVWSWGVIHHSADTSTVLQGIRRVLRPGGRAVIMVYHRNFWNYYVYAGLLHGLLRGMWFRTRSLHKIQQLTTDGALARFYTAAEWRAMVSGLFTIDKVEVMGSKSHLLPLPPGHFKERVGRAFPNALVRLLANRMGMGYFLVSHLR